MLITVEAGQWVHGVQYTIISTFCIFENFHDQKDIFLMIAWLIGQQHQRGDFWNNNDNENELHIYQGHFYTIKKLGAQALKLGRPGYKFFLA